MRLGYRYLNDELSNHGSEEMEVYWRKTKYIFYKKLKVNGFVIKNKSLQNVKTGRTEDSVPFFPAQIAYFRNVVYFIFPCYRVKYLAFRLPSEWMTAVNEWIINALLWAPLLRNIRSFFGNGHNSMCLGKPTGK